MYMRQSAVPVEFLELFLGRTDEDEMTAPPLVPSPKQRQDESELLRNADGNEENESKESPFDSNRSAQPNAEEPVSAELSAVKRRKSAPSLPCATSLCVCAREPPNRTPNPSAGLRQPMSPGTHTGVGAANLWKKALQKGKLASMFEQTKMAAYCVDDAFHGRLSNGKAVMSTKDPLTFQIFLFHIGDGWHCTLLAANFVHCLLAMYEPPRRLGLLDINGEAEENAPPNFNIALLLVEGLCVMIYVVDIALKMHYQTARVFLSCEGGKVWQAYYFLAVFFLALDIVTSGPTALSRPLRPIVTLLRSRSVRRFYTVLTRMMAKFLRVCSPIIFFLACCSVSMARVVGCFHPVHHDISSVGQGPEDDVVGTGDGGAWYDNYGGDHVPFEALPISADSFETVTSTATNHVPFLDQSFQAFVELFVLLMTQENYVPMRDFLTNHSTVCSVAFYVFVVVGPVFLISLVLGAAFDAYQTHTRDQVRSELLKERRGLTKAFAELDPHGTGELAQWRWKGLLAHLRPDCGVLEAEILYAMLANGRDKVDAIDFLRLREVLKYKVVRGDAGAEKKGEAGASAVLWDAVLALCAQIRQCWLFGWVEVALLAMDMALLAADAECHPVAMGPQHGSSAVAWNSLILAALWVITLLEIGSAGGLEKYWFEAEWPARLDLSVLGVCTLAFLLPGAGCGLLGGGACSLGALRVLRIIKYNTTLQLFGRSFASVLMVLAQTVGFASVVMYFFAILGTETLGSDRHFATFQDAFATMVQLQFGVNFGEVMDGAVASSGLGAPFVVSFFLAYFFFAVLLVMNLATALMIEFYSHILTTQVDTDQSKQEQIMIEKLLARSVLDAWVGKEVIKRMSLTRITQDTLDDLRRGLGSGEDFIGVEDLKKCQKYARVDLLALDAKRKGEAAS